MGTIARGKLPHLIEDLLRNPSAYRAFQALYLIETNIGEEADIEDNPQAFISIAPAAEMTFPAGEIRHCRVDERDRYRLELNFMGFYGVDTPLPQFFNDIATFDTPRGAELRGFLELFNQRLYQLLYSAWKKMNLHGSSDTRTSLYCRYLEALYGGSGTCHLLGRFDYAGILANRVKNGQSLADMLDDYLHCPVTVKQNIPCWIELEETASLGGELKLGDNAMLGNRLMDVNSKILLRIGPLSSHDAAELLPGRPAAATLAHMIREYLDPALQYDVEMLILPDTGYESVLGGNPSILGWTACLGRAGDTVNRVRLTGENMDQQRHSSSNRNRNPNRDRNRTLT
jgi:type VI secretion system protein ImpH